MRKQYILLCITAISFQLVAEQNVTEYSSEKNIVKNARTRN